VIDDGAVSTCPVLANAGVSIAMNGILVDMNGNITGAETLITKFGKVRIVDICLNCALNECVLK